VSAAPQGARHTRPTLRVTIAGEPRALAEGTTVAELLATLGLAGRPCAVEINRTIVPRSAHAAHQLREGDAVEIVGFVGGG
jgi:sulfur carrier protein